MMWKQAVIGWFQAHFSICIEELEYSSVTNVRVTADQDRWSHKWKLCEFCLYSANLLVIFFLHTFAFSNFPFFCPFFPFYPFPDASDISILIFIDLLFSRPLHLSYFHFHVFPSLFYDKSETRRINNSAVFRRNLKSEQSAWCPWRKSGNNW